MSRYLREPPSVLNIIFQRGTYDRTMYVVEKNELKVSIPSEYLYKQPSSNENISQTIVSLINHDGDSLDFGHYVSYVFDSSTGIWWHCVLMTISLKLVILPKEVYYRETHKLTNKRK